MKRTQIQLTDQQARRLREIAAAEDRSVADIVRESVETYIASRGHISREELIRRSLAAIGKFRSGVKDLGTKHDKYFVEAIEDWKSS